HRGWNVLLRQWICRAGRCRRACSANVRALGLLRIAMADKDAQDAPDLSISPEKVCYIIAKAREFDAKDVVTDPNDSSNPTDDAMVGVLEDHRDDPVVQEIAAAIFAMTEDEQSIWSRSLSSAVVTVRSRIGMSCARRPRAPITSAPVHICSACH